jgi:hypothetical protein
VRVFSGARRFLTERTHRKAVEPAGKPQGGRDVACKARKQEHGQARFPAKPST